jgi:hypothetical protein
MLQSSGRYATRDRRRCYNLPAALLQAVDAAAGDATISRPLCYKRSTPPPAMLQSPGRSATRDRLRCYKVPPAMLQSPGRSATSGRRRRCYKPPLLQAAATDATGRPRGCYIASAVLLQAKLGRATGHQRRCSERRPTLLRLAPRVATKEWRRCYRPSTAVLPCISGVAGSGARRRYRPTEALLRLQPRVATKVWRRRYRPSTAHLPAILQGAASGSQECCYQRSSALGCYKSSGGLLRRRSGIATMVEGDCYHGGYQVLRLCCKGRPGQPRWSWTAVRSQAGCPWRRARNCLCASSRGPGGVLVFFFFFVAWPVSGSRDWSVCVRGPCGHVSVAGAGGSGHLIPRGTLSTTLMRLFKTKLGSHLSKYKNFY